MVVTVPLYMMTSHSQALQYWPAVSTNSMAAMTSGATPKTWQEPITVLHFDSHIDMADVHQHHCQKSQGASRNAGECWESVWNRAEATMDDNRRARESRPELHRLAGDRVDLSNFLTAAVLEGSADNVIWVRSDFDGYGVYHGPATGRYVMSIVRDKGRTCFNILETLELFEGPVKNGRFNPFPICDPGLKVKSKFTEIEFQFTVITLEQLVAQFRESKQTIAATLDKTQGTARLGVNVKSTEVLTVSKVDGGCAQEWNERHPESAIRVGDRVVKVNGIKGVPAMLDQLKSSPTLRLTLERAIERRGLGWVLHRGMRTPEKRDWVLDIDLDTFATHDPPFAIFAENNFSDGFVRRLGFLLDTARLCTDKYAEFVDAPSRVSHFCGCLSRGNTDAKVVHNAKKTFTAVADMPSLFFERSKYAPSPLEKSDLVHAPLRRMDKTCSLGEEYAAEAFDLLANLTEAQAVVWKAMFHKVAEHQQTSFDVTRALFQGFVPSGVHCSRPEETERHFEYFEEILGHLLPDARSSLPRVITVCRSTSDERFLPRQLWPSIERHALEALRTVFAPFGGYDLKYAASTEPLQVEPLQEHAEL